MANQNRPKYDVAAMTAEEIIMKQAAMIDQLQKEKRELAENLEWFQRGYQRQRLEINEATEAQKKRDREAWERQRQRLNDLELEIERNRWGICGPGGYAGPGF